MESPVYSLRPTLRSSPRVRSVVSLFSGLLTPFLEKAKAVYTYTAGNADELPFNEGDELSIIDMSEDEWWKTEKDGVVLIAPAAYLEIVEG